MLRAVTVTVTVLAILLLCGPALAADATVACGNTADATVIQAALDAASSGDTVSITGTCAGDAMLTVARGITLRIVGTLRLTADHDGVSLANGAALMGAGLASTITSASVAGYAESLVLIPSGTANHSYQTCVSSLRLTQHATAIGIGLHLLASGAQVTGAHIENVTISGGGVGVKIEDAFPLAAEDYATNNRFSDVHVYGSTVGYHLTGTADGNQITGSDYQCLAGTSYAVLCEGCDNNYLSIMVWDAQLAASPTTIVTFDADSGRNVYSACVSCTQVSNASGTNVFTVTP